MNVENLLKVKALILEEPKRFNMNQWMILDMDHVNPEVRPSCNTVACIAGWGVTLRVLESSRSIKKLATAANGVESWNVEYEAAEFFDIPNHRATGLFFESNWPRDLEDRLKEQSPGTPEYAAIAAEAIDRFIACGGEWWTDPGPAASA